MADALKAVKLIYITSQDGLIVNGELLAAPFVAAGISAVLWARARLRIPAVGAVARSRAGLRKLPTRPTGRISTLGD